MRKRSVKKENKENSRTKSKVIKKGENIDITSESIKKLYDCTYILKNEYYGFAKSYSDEIPDIYISNKFNEFFGLMNGDKIQVLLMINPINGKKSGKVIKIIERHTKTLVGKYHNGFVKPIDSRICEVEIINVDYMEASNGDEVLVAIRKYPRNIRIAQGKIIEVYKNRTLLDTLVNALFVEYQLDQRGNFDELKEELEKLSDVITEQDMFKRIDKTMQITLAIDPINAKDYDDAVSIEEYDNGNFLLSVHIADVSHYVKEGSLIDKRAAASATSIYIPGTVVPMLPEKISNNICSLKEGLNRLSLSIDILLDKNGHILENHIYKSVIRVNKNMTYNEVFNIISNNINKVPEDYKEYIPTIILMNKLAKILKKNRLSKGSINFDIPETKVVLDKLGNIQDIKSYEINAANNLIEEFMLIANMTIAEKFFNLGAPFIYRVHEDPDIEKLLLLNGILADYGIKIKSVENIQPKTISNILNSITDEKVIKVISERILRTLKQARYNNELIRHFGLAANYYCHFTSPIRRYPDLFIHRVMTKYIEEDYIVNTKKINIFSEQAAKYSEISSKKGREATEIEREFDKLYKTVFMMNKIGDEFDGIISSITKNGIYIKLENTVEGFIQCNRLPEDQYSFIEEKFMLIGKNTKNVYKIGDTYNVKLVAADPYARQIDFELILN